MQYLRVRHEEHTTHAHAIDPSTCASPHAAGTIDLAYQVIGSGDQNLIFIPGMCLTHSMWEKQVHTLRQNGAYRLILPDNRGSGESSHPKPDGKCTPVYTIHAMARDTLAIIRHVLGPRARVHVLGHSMGSMIAQRLVLLEHAPTILSLTLLCGHDGGWFWNTAPSFRLLCAGLKLLCTDDAAVCARVYMRLHFTRGFLDAKAGDGAPRKDGLLRRYVDGLVGVRGQEGSDFWGHLMAVRSHGLSLRDARRISEMRFSKVVVYGRDDAVVLPRSSRQLAGRIGALPFAVESAHFAMEEAAAQINQLIALHVEFAHAVS